MATLYLLGTGSSISDPERTTTMLAVENSCSLILIDCGGDALQRLMQSSFSLQDIEKLEAIFITHEHIDHISGFPLLLQKLWLAGYKKDLNVYGIKPALEQVKSLVNVVNTFKTKPFDAMPKLHWHEIAYQENVLFFENDCWCVNASPGNHGVPVMGLRFLDKEDGGILTYSSDTQKSDNIIRLAESANILVHEATGNIPTHSNAQQAAEVARSAKVKELFLVHLPPEAFLSEDEMNQAKKIFPNMAKGKEGGKYKF